MSDPKQVVEQIASEADVTADQVEAAYFGLAGTAAARLRGEGSEP